MDIIKRIFSKRTPDESVPQLKGTELRTKYGKAWSVRDVALYGLGVNVTLCKSDEFFERIMGVTPTEYLIAREARRLHENFSEGHEYVCMYFEDKDFMRFIRLVNFTFVMDVKKQKKLGYHGNVVNGFKKLDAYVNA